MNTFIKGGDPVLDPIKTIVNPTNERSPDRKLPNKQGKKRKTGPQNHPHLQLEATGERIDFTA